MSTHHAGSQTKRLFELTDERLAALEAQNKLNHDRLDRIGDDLGGLQAIAHNALAVRAKTELYADLLAGMVSTEVPEPLDVESFLATLQALSVPEIGIARTMYETWRRDPQQQGTRSLSRGPCGHTQYYMKRLEGAGLVVPVMYGGRPGMAMRENRFELTPPLLELVARLEAGRAGSSGSAASAS